MIGSGQLRLLVLRTTEVKIDVIKVALTLVRLHVHVPRLLHHCELITQCMGNARLYFLVESGVRGGKPVTTS